MSSYDEFAVTVSSYQPPRQEQIVAVLVTHHLDVDDVFAADEAAVLEARGMIQYVGEPDEFCDLLYQQIIAANAAPCAVEIDIWYSDRDPDFSYQRGESEQMTVDMNGG